MSFEPFIAGHTATRRRGIQPTGTRTIRSSRNGIDAHQMSGWGTWYQNHSAWGNVASMALSTTAPKKASAHSWFPPARWLAEYRPVWLSSDLVAGMTLAAYAIPVSLAYAGLAGLPPQVGVYGYLLGGLGYALLGSSRQLAVGPTSAISLMIAGSVGAMAQGDAQHYAEIASLAAFTVAGICLVAWPLGVRLSVVLHVAV